MSKNDHDQVQVGQRPPVEFRDPEALTDWLVATAVKMRQAGVHSFSIMGVASVGIMPLPGAQDRGEEATAEERAAYASEVIADALDDPRSFTGGRPSFRRVKG